MFRDRTDAGQRLAQALMTYKGQPVAVYALPRGGVVLGVEIARALEAPLDLIVVRKIGHPYAQEYAIGAVAEDGYVIMNPEEASTLDQAWIRQAVAAELQEAQRRRELFMGSRPAVPANDKIAIIVDDGLATGLTMQAAIHEIRKRSPRQVVVAVPVAAPTTVEKLRPEVDELVALYIPKGFFGAIGAFYERFEQISDAEVVALLDSTTQVRSE